MSAACPICAAPLEASPRYPRVVCLACHARAVDETGRRVAFFNESFSGGLLGEYVDTREPYRLSLCFIDGVRCKAQEAHMGGVVIQVLSLDMTGD